MKMMGQYRQKPIKINLIYTIKLLIKILKMKLLIKFPTKGRLFKFFRVLDIYYEMCLDLNNTKFLITLDNDDEVMNQPEVIKMFEKYQNLKFIFGDSKSKIDAVNRDIDTENNWDILLLASDDMIPIVNGYDQIIRNKMKSHYPDTDGVLWFNDGNQGNKLNTLSIIGKKYYERFNYIYNPNYISLWSDNEFMEVANKLNKQIYFNDVIIKHEHPDWGFGSRDKIHLDNTLNNSADYKTYLLRKNKNFDIIL